jgi:PAS domain S-box-containing protein
MTYNILFIDDEPDVLELTKKFIDIFSIGEYNTHTTNSPEKAIVMLKNNHFDVVVSDYQMPKIDGLDLLHIIRNDLKKKTPFILMTGHGREEVAMRALNLGANYYIQKNINTELLYKELLHNINKSLENEKIKNELEKSNEKFDLFFKSATENMYLLDADLNIIEINGANKNNLFPNYTLDEMIGKNLVEIVPFLKNSDRLIQYKQVIETGKPLHLTKALSYLNDREYYFNISAFKVGNGLGIITTDITDFVTTELALKKSNATLEQYLQSTTENVVIFDHELNIIHINKSNQEIFFPEFELDELKGKNIVEVAPYIVKTQRYQQYKDVLETGNPLNIRELKVNLGTKTYFLMIKAFRIEDGSKKLLGMISTDITEIKMTENRLREQKKFIENFLTEFGHDAKNLISVIDGNAQQLKKEIDSIYLTKIIKGTETISNLWRNSIEYVKSGLIIFEKENVDLNKIVNSLAETIIPEGVTFTSVINLPIVSCDPIKIKQVFQNLFLNAIKHGDPKNIKVEFENNNIFVRNDGNPFPEEKKNILSEKATISEEGHGIGLNIVKRIVEAHGWKIFLETKEWTTFEIALPK